MPSDGIWTAAELEQMTPDERHRLVNDSVITDLSQLPEDTVARLRSSGRTLIEQHQHKTSSPR